jgi:hypothetical protein
MNIPDHASPATIILDGHARYTATTAWLSDGMVHAVCDRTVYFGDPPGTLPRPQPAGDVRLRSWPSRRCTIDWGQP